ncbi:hypothetical protein SDRG_15432 [Saprolegnia diclina VS20]|uniref:F-box domain-containing protein n=1 Tax=Saprolegnia diclina (strain VS20) TaxID=1156394 RepID=T0RB51_SAPDV|nr:hypothetical protein SDRG_15432 [Saprolegnia diclina VS20]EQC26782.1 hypothetical protein SDRG_15432 [Saprolegnia diclina VS20]|eukprot:XP_008619825.1 hypothetical protein SDRG_15432 [Saprolegnia diclina VS20]
MAVADVVVLAATAIVPYVASPYDVRALLVALPANMRSGPLAALLTLLQSPAAFLEQWPVVCLEDVALRYRPLALLALPVLPSIVIRRFRDLPIVGRRELVAFLTAWPITSIQVSNDDDGDWDVDLFAAALPRCARLAHIGVSISMFARLRRWLPPSVRRVTLARDPWDSTVDYTDAVDMTPLLTWPQTATLTHLCLDCVGYFENALVANALATAPSLQCLDLRSMELDGSDIVALVDVLVAAKMTLPHVTELRLDGVDELSVAKLLSLIDGRRLTRLDVHYGENLSFLIALLPTLPALETLCFGYGMLDFLPAPTAHKCLRHVSFDTFMLATEDVSLLLDWTCGLSRLERISFCNFTLGEGPRASMQRALCHWFNRASVTYVRLERCDLDEDAAADVASALSSRTSPLALDLVQNGLLGQREVRCLFDALAPLPTSTLRASIVAEHRDEIVSYARQRGLMVDDSGDGEYTFCSVGRVL